jgi:RND family efflux transporter MFP subunit
MKPVLLTLFWLPFLAACGDAPPPAATGPAAPRLVRTVVVGATSEPSLRYSGEVRARHETALAFRVGGKMTERTVDVGARVRPGQPLARLDPADARLAQAQAEAGHALAAAELKRAEDLQARNFLSKAALDARLSAARSAEAQAQLARNQAAYTTLAADVPGVIAAVLADAGQVVAAGQPVFRLARDGEREVAIALPESAMAGIRVGAEAQIGIWADGARYRGRVREVAPVADPATRTFAARVTIIGAGGELPLGATATATFPTPGGDRLVVPLAAVFQQDGRPAVWRVGKDGAVQLQAIEIERFGDSGAVVKSGLTGGEQIVAAGAFKLTAGEKVRIAGEPPR